MWATTNQMRRNMRGYVVVFLLAAIVFLAAIVWSIIYTGPSSQTISVPGFFQLWFRELLIFGVLIIGLIAVTISRLRQFKNRADKEKLI